ncbi:hypothetical protein PVAP13_4NG330100 [Panicum virgatum]|uniref:Uncharacterized protein n=1 Tax=Panicum virgatum TaxID=38727 RepID=A0A8T0TIQ3_PANVG|nr:hypothetical protein PVAP13_4NG330100 [Panicum virgatum]
MRPCPFAPTSAAAGPACLDPRLHLLAPSSPYSRAFGTRSREAPLHVRVGPRCSTRHRPHRPRLRNLVTMASSTCTGCRRPSSGHPEDPYRRRAPSTRPTSPPPLPHADLHRPSSRVKRNRRHGLLLHRDKQHRRLQLFFLGSVSCRRMPPPIRSMVTTARLVPFSVASRRNAVREL